MLLKSWISSFSRSLKYYCSNLENYSLADDDNNDQRDGRNNDLEGNIHHSSILFERLISEFETNGQNVNIENESTRLLNQHAISDLEDAKDYRSLVSLGKSTVTQTMFNAVNVLVGIAILALPYAFKCSGWIIGISTFFFCLISTNYTAKILKKCLDTDPECLTYADLAYLAYGQKGKIFIGFIFLMDLYNAAVALMILVGDSLKILFPQMDLTHLKLISFLVITPITWLPINYLSYTSLLGIFTAASLALVLLIDGLTKFDAPGSLWQPMNTHLLPPSWMVLPLSFGLINSAFSGHAVFPSLYRDMAKPLYYKKTVNSSYLITGIIYFTVAVCGYLMFGSETMQEITQSIMSTQGYSLFLNSVVVWLIVINPLAKFPLTLTPINLSIEVATLVSFLIVGTAIVFPTFDRAMSLLGSCFSFLISSIFPILCHLKMFGTIWTFLPSELLGDG
ncbi:23830_t:CDS:2 [Dentiscutata erythropus]|uniref:23830_t:CDS:1 n=1 Tax=Dentiscutata erythropus TaxID=1348616 RepID=A0A9N9IVY0_9GLOM|nr:23830_t:CDS:2 [Dentiscutata erythropus]